MCIRDSRNAALAAIMYGSDYDDTIPITTNGWLCRMQNIRDKRLTVNCPAPGTQDLEAKDAAKGQRTDAWPLLLLPYSRSRELYIDPRRSDATTNAASLKIWRFPAAAASDSDYDPE